MFAHENISAQEKMGRVFGAMGSRESSKREQELRSRLIAGVKVPAKPQEPTNCCMSGCVNCVWELYKDEIDEWKGLRNRAKKALLGRPDIKWPEDFGTEPDRSRPGAASIKEEDPDEDLPMSIRVFVQMEKKLHRKRQERKKALQQEAAAVSDSTTAAQGSNQNVHK